MKLTSACLNDLSALLEIEAEAGQSYADQNALWELRRDFRDTYGLDWLAAKEAANRYAREWRRHR